MKSESCIRVFWRIIILIVLWSTQSCIPTRHLGEGEYAIYSQRVDSSPNFSEDELKQFVRQKENKQLIFRWLRPYQYFYYWGVYRYESQRPKWEQKKKDVKNSYSAKIRDARTELFKYTTMGLEGRKKLKAYEDSVAAHDKIRSLIRKRNEKTEKLALKIEKGNIWMRSVGEPPVVFDSSYAQTSELQMEKYMASKGYFEAEAHCIIDTFPRKRLVSVRYAFKEGMPKRIRKVQFDILDTLLAKVVLGDTLNSLIHSGAIYKESDLKAERDRIYKLLRDNGYFKFYRNYILFEVDSFVSQDSIDIKTVILNPPQKNRHKVYRLDSVVVDTDVYYNGNTGDVYVNDFNDVTYIFKTSYYAKKALDSKIFLRKGMLYSQQNSIETQKALGAVDIFKFVDVRYDSTDDGFIGHIYLSPYKKYQLTAETGLGMTQTLPGPFGSLSYKNRNLLKNLDVFQLGGRAAVEAQSAVTDFSDQLYSTELGINTSLVFPRIIFPLGYKLKQKLRLNYPKTRLAGGWNFVDRPEYTRSNVQAALQYMIRNQRSALWTLGLLDVSVVNTQKMLPEFRERLMELYADGNPLIFSFDNSLITATTLSYTKASTTSSFSSERSKFFIAYIESAGTYLNAFETASQGEERTSVFGLRYYRYLKAFSDFRRNVKLSDKSRLAMRTMGGFAIPYGKNLTTLPYEKYFFSGGSNSNRAWGARRVGPGSYRPPVREDGTFDYSFEQSGEVIIELNIEYRTKLFSFFDWAFFIDASNVWMTREDNSRPGAKFELEKFYTEFAIGAGYGLRLNFQFLIIRFDMGIKMYDPARPLNNRFIGDNLSLAKPFGEPGQAIFNFSIGYPF